MSDKHAARQGDKIIHSSIFADITSLVAEGLAYAAIGSAVAVAATAAAPLAGAGAAAAGLAAIGSSCALSGIIGGILANAAGITDDISNMATGIGNAIFPPSPAGTIATGSANVLTNKLPAARAAGKLTPGDTPPPEPQKPGSFADYGGMLLSAAAQFGSEMWQPTVATAAPGTSSLELDTVLCDKHSGPQYLAEGSKSVFINGQPAVRAKDRTTCEATISDDVSPNVIIGGETLTVRNIKSGKTAGLAVAMIALSLIRGRPGNILKNMPCALVSAGAGMLTDMAINAVFASSHPVHAATGVKVLNDNNELDFSLPGRFPLRWQRSYNSLTTREGLFGLGWATAFDSYLTLEGGEVTWFDETGRELRFTLPPLNQALYSISEGLIVRRNENGDVAIADDDGAVWRLFKPTRANPSVLRLASLSDEYGNALETGWDEHGRLVRIHDAPCAIDVTLRYEDKRFAQRVTSAVHFDGEREWPLVTYRYDGRGQLAAVTDAAGITTREYRYNDAGLMIWHRLPGGLESEYRWEQFDHWRVVENRTSTGDGCRIAYDLAAGLTTVTQYDGQTRQHYWNAQGLITRFVDERGESWRYEWNEHDLLIRRVDPLGNATTFVYDDMGNRVQEVDAEGNIRATQWLEHRALPAAITEADGTATRFYYDEHHGLARIVDALGQTTLLRRDEFGQIVEEVDAAGNSRHQEYNDAGQVIRATDCSGRVTRYRYHPLGWLSTAISADGEETRYHYDAAGRPIQLERPEGWEERLLWNARGLPEAHEGADGKRSEFTYDAAGRLVSTSNPQGDTVRRRWDSRGRLIALENEKGEAYQFRWGADSLLLEEESLDGVITRYGYDACGRTILRTFAAGHPEAITHTFAWSAAGQLLSRTTPEGQTRYDYTPAGLISRIALHASLAENVWSREAEQELRFEYDALGRVIGEQSENGALGWTYDALGSRTSVQLPDGRMLKHHFYGSGHLLSIALDNLPVTDFTRDELHRELSRTQGLLTSRNEYDRLGRLTRRDVFTGDAQRPAPRRWSRRWDYDYRNNLIREERDDNPFSWYRWKYDSAGRLLTQDGTLPGQEQWQWDAAGNPLDNSATQTVRFNRVTQLNGIQWRYDIHGRTVEKDNGQTRWRYCYDGEHRLTDVISQPRDRNKPQVEVSFRYDPLGRRISKTRRQLLAGQPTGKTVTTRFVWEGFRLLQEIHDEVPLTYVYSDPHSYEPLARIDGTQSSDIYWFHNQPNGTPERLTDVEGRLRWEGRNSAWGKLAHESTPLPTGYHQNLRMQGQYLDRETGLHYNLFRYYDPDCGRFTQHDPIGLAGGINLYQFAPNALGWVDPWGLKCGFSQKNRITQRWVDRLTGKKPADVHNILTSKGWTRTYPQANKPGAIQHIQYVKTTKSGTTYKLDYHPGGTPSQPNVHGNDYWKVYREVDGTDVVYGRIGHGEFKNYDLITDSPVYVDGILLNGGV
ncbi:RHS repeat-associated core domain-containing protein [Cronobacter sakazakii]|uniref:RHS repeat-associated core domain-containing protein n=1 Tax=Cronobacter sakazakii TaxID=28141 RepID=UPI001F1A1C72|nr:RHS repeat-associated core domain-containing protein [Cronobacter sakazakii]MDK1250854.1 RHS repeat-associated core domain-containing protein [Cronobacter sakazakii]